MSGILHLLRKWFYLWKVNRSKTPQPATVPEPLPDADSVDATQIDVLLNAWFKYETDELIEGFEIASEDVVLNIGCGDSPFLTFCALQGADVMLADIAPQKVAKLNQMLVDSPARSVMPIVCDACHLPIEDASVSKIIAMEVMEHIEEPQIFLKELVRVGKTGAQYLITVPDTIAETLQKELAPPDYFEKPNHIHIFERRDFEKLVFDAGLIVEEFKLYGFYWAIWWIFFWACKHDLSSPWHPMLISWTQTWHLLMDSEDGPKIKRVLDNFLPKSQAIIARKPA